MEVYKGKASIRNFFQTVQNLDEQSEIGIDSGESNTIDANKGTETIAKSSDLQAHRSMSLSNSNVSFGTCVIASIPTEINVFSEESRYVHSEDDPNFVDLCCGMGYSSEKEEPL